MNENLPGRPPTRRAAPVGPHGPSARGLALVAWALAAVVALGGGCEGNRRKRPAAPPPASPSPEQRLDALESRVAFLQRELERFDEDGRRLEQVARRIDAVEVGLERMDRQRAASSVGDHPLDALPRPSEAGSTLAERRPPPDLPLPKPLPPPGEAPTTSSPAPPAASVTVRERTAEELFRLGVRHFEAGELGPALDKLRLYLERAPAGPKADEALFLIGQAELARGRPLLAVESFLQLAAAFPESPRRPEALFHGGEAFRRLYDKPQALRLWKELEVRYPSHPMAAKAREAIRKLASER